MRKVENAAVASIVAGDAATARDHLSLLLIHDRRRAWWALFRAAAERKSDGEARLARTVRIYIARRAGELIGTRDEELLIALMEWIMADRIEQPEPQLSSHERRLITHWLPARLAKVVFWQPH